MRVGCDNPHTYPNVKDPITKGVWSPLSRSHKLVAYPICEVDMPKVRVVVLSSHSLYGEGILTCLKAYQNALELLVIDAEHTDALDQIIAIQPSAVILDAGDHDVAVQCPLGRLLWELPDVRIIHLDTINKGFQLVTSEQHEAEEVQELLAILKPDEEANEG